MDNFYLKLVFLHGHRWLEALFWNSLSSLFVAGPNPIYQPVSTYTETTAQNEAPPCLKGFPGGSDGRESTRNVGDLGLIPGLGRSSGGGHGNPFQYSCLENLHAQRSLVGCSLSYSPWGHK